MDGRLSLSGLSSSKCGLRRNMPFGQFLSIFLAFRLERIER
jgi:hypothetical protein